MRPLIDERLSFLGEFSVSARGGAGVVGDMQSDIMRAQAARAAAVESHDRHMANIARWRAATVGMTPEEAHKLKPKFGISLNPASGAGLFDPVVKAGGAIIKAAGDIVTAPLDVIAAATKSIPVLGDMTRIVNDAASAPANLANSIASGARIDRAVVAHLKSQLKTIKEAAPYAQMIVSVVPGVGTGVAAAIGAGAALAEGKSIDEAAKAAIRGALPGGAAVAAGYDTALKIASGANVAQSVIESAREALPANMHQAFDIGLAVVTGENIQNAFTSGLVNLTSAQLGSLVSAGSQAIASSPVLATAFKSISPGMFSSMVPGGAGEGFNAAIGLLSQAGINEKSVAAVRARLGEEARRGFDAALKTQENEIAWLKNVPLQTARDAIAQARALAPRRPPGLTPAPAPRRAPPALGPAPAPVRTPPVLTPVAPPARKPSPTAVAPQPDPRRGIYGPYPQA